MSNLNKYAKLAISIFIDFVGILTYLIPAIGEGGDLAWAPISGVLIAFLYPNRKKMALLGALEELIPLTDFFPTATLTWFLEYVIDK